MWRAFPRAPVRRLAGAWLLFAACSHAPREGARSWPSADVAGPGQNGAYVRPARFIPDVSAGSLGVVDLLSDGSRRLIVSGMRVIDHADGSIERARQVLPDGTPRLFTLPSPLRGGNAVAPHSAGRGNRHSSRCAPGGHLARRSAGSIGAGAAGRVEARRGAGRAGTRARVSRRTVATVRAHHRGDGVGPARRG